MEITMSRFLAVIVVLVIAHCTSGSTVNSIRLWLSPAPPTPGWFVSEVATDQSMQSRDTVTRQGTPEDVPAPSQPVDSLDGLPALAGEAYYVWGRFDAPSLEGTRVSGMNLQVLTSGNLSVNYIWYNWRSPPTGSPVQLRWELGSDLAGSEIQVIGLGDGAARGWINAPTSFANSDRLDAYPIAPTIVEPSGDIFGQSAILLGKIGWQSGVGDLMLRLGANGLRTGAGSVVAFGTGTTFISAGIGASGRGYGVQGRFIPEPATLTLLALGALAARRRLNAPIRSPGSTRRGLYPKSSQGAL
jgi:hypothetical protein